MSLSKPIPLQVDKTESLVIVNQILSHVRANNAICLHKNMVLTDYYDSEDLKQFQTRVVPYTHQLAVAEIELDLCQKAANLADHTDQILQLVKTQSYHSVKSVEIHFGSKIQQHDNAIALVTYLHDSETASCDLSFPSFTYDAKLQMWIVCDDSWDAPNGIDSNGIVTVLDFDAYTTDSTR